METINITKYKSRPSRDCYTGSPSSTRQRQLDTLKKHTWVLSLSHPQVFQRQNGQTCSVLDNFRILGSAALALAIWSWLQYGLGNYFSHQTTAGGPHLAHS